MSQSAQILRNHSVFQLLGVEPDSNQEEDLKVAELGTLRQFLLILKKESFAADIVSQIETKLDALEAATQDAFTTQLDAVYAFLSEKFPNDLSDRLEAAVEEFKRDILVERIAFLKDRMSEHVSNYFVQADKLLESNQLDDLLAYLSEIQNYLKSALSDEN